MPLSGDSHGKCGGPEYSLLPLFGVPGESSGCETKTKQKNERQVTRGKMWPEFTAAQIF